MLANSFFCTNFVTQKEDLSHFLNIREANAFIYKAKV